MVAHELGQKTQPIHARHLDVEGEHIRIELGDLVPGDVGVRGDADHLDAGKGGQPFEQHPAHSGAVVDDQDAHRLHVTWTLAGAKEASSVGKLLERGHRLGDWWTARKCYPRGR